MSLALRFLGVLLLLVGVVWMLQGANILPGSFMTGQIQWAIYGAVAAGLGFVLLIVARKHRRQNHQ